MPVCVSCVSVRPHCLLNTSAGLCACGVGVFVGVPGAEGGLEGPGLGAVVRPTPGLHLSWAVSRHSSTLGRCERWYRRVSATFRGASLSLMACFNSATLCSWSVISRSVCTQDNPRGSQAKQAARVDPASSLSPGAASRKQPVRWLWSRRAAGMACTAASARPRAPGGWGETAQPVVRQLWPELPQPWQSPAPALVNNQKDLEAAQATLTDRVRGQSPARPRPSPPIFSPPARTRQPLLVVHSSRPPPTSPSFSLV